MGAAWCLSHCSPRLVIRALNGLSCHPAGALEHDDQVLNCPGVAIAMWSRTLRTPCHLAAARLPCPDQLDRSLAAVLPALGLTPAVRSL